MPNISYFYGIDIYMYFKDDEHRHLPHFHAEYAGAKISVDFDGNVLAKNTKDKFPDKKLSS